MIVKDYKCSNCGSNKFSLFQEIDSSIAVRCDKCGKLWCVAPDDWKDAVIAQQEIIERVRREKLQ